MSRRLTIYPDFEGYTDVANALIEQYGQAYLPEWLYTHISPEDLIECIRGHFDPEDVYLMLDEDFARGLLMGYVLAMLTIQQAEEDGEKLT